MNRAAQEWLLARTERHIASAVSTVERQRQFVDRVASKGTPGRLVGAKMLLDQFEGVLASVVAERDQIKREIASSQALTH